jgi:hypothetical protein
VLSFTSVAFASSVKTCNTPHWDVLCVRLLTGTHSDVREVGSKYIAYLRRTLTGTGSQRKQSFNNDDNVMPSSSDSCVDSPTCQLHRFDAEFGSGPIGRSYQATRTLRRLPPIEPGISC